MLLWRARKSASLAGGVVGAAEVAGFAPGARFRRGSLAHVALASRFLQHVLHLVQLGRSLRSITSKDFFCSAELFRNEIGSMVLLRC
jgi:hypothetical protein